MKHARVVREKQRKDEPSGGRKTKTNSDYIVGRHAALKVILKNFMIGG